MFRPRFGQQLLMSIALGLFVLPAVSWATTVTLPAPFRSDTATPASLSVVHDITINNDGAVAPNTVYFGTLDLNNNAMVFSPSIQDAAHAQALFTKVYDMVRSGSDFLNWDGTGVTSSLAAVDAAHYKGAVGVGVILNDAGLIGDPGAALWGTAGDLGTPWMGYNPTQFDTLVSYTYLGDSFLRGFVDSADTAQLVSNLHTLDHTNPWGNSDYVYQSEFGLAVDSSDTAALVAGLGSFNNHDYPHTVTFAQGGAGGSLSVPEPGAVVLALMGFLALIGTRFVNRNTKIGECV
jgi:hypothetical protein